MKKYKGIYVPIITPIDENENVDEKGFRQLIDHAIRGGIHGLLVAGSNGECMALTQEQREKAIEIAIDECAGRIPVVGGVMDSSTVRVIENIKRLEQMGGEAAIITPVFYARHASEMEIFSHFEKISAQTNLDLFIYNIPKFTGCTIKCNTIFEIAKLPHVVGYKDSSGNFTDFVKCLTHFKGTDFMIFQGATMQLAPSFLMGADGCVPALAILFPKLFIGLYQACLEKDYDAIWRYNTILVDAQRILELSKNATAATKFAISLLGYTDKRVTNPQDRTTIEEEALITAQVKKVEDELRHLDAQVVFSHENE